MEKGADQHETRPSLPSRSACHAGGPAQKPAIAGARATAAQEARCWEVLGSVPAGLIENENGVRARFDLGFDLVEMRLHGFAVADRQDEGDAAPRARGRPPRTDRSMRWSCMGGRSRALRAQAVGHSS